MHGRAAYAGIVSIKHNSHRGLTKVALLARREKVVPRGSSASSEWHDVVNVQHDARRTAGATAVTTAKAIALQDAKSHLRTNGIAGSPRAAICRRPFPDHRIAALRAVPPLAPCGRGEGAS